MRMALISEGVSQWAITSAFLLVPEQLLYCYFQWLLPPCHSLLKALPPIFPVPVRRTSLPLAT